MEKNLLHRLATTATNYLHFDRKHATNWLCVGTRCGLHLRVMLPLSWNTPLLYHQEKYDGNQIQIFHKLIRIVSLSLRLLQFMSNLTKVLCDSLSLAFPSLFLYCKAKSTINCTASIFLAGNILMISLSTCIQQVRKHWAVHVIFMQLVVTPSSDFVSFSLWGVD